MGLLNDWLTKIPLKDHLQGKARNNFFGGAPLASQMTRFLNVNFLSKESSGLICQHLYEIHPEDVMGHGRVCMETSA